MPEKNDNMNIDPGTHASGKDVSGSPISGWINKLKQGRFIKWPYFRFKLFDTGHNEFVLEFDNQEERDLYHGSLLSPTNYFEQNGTAPYE